MLQSQRRGQRDRRGEPESDRRCYDRAASNEGWAANQRGEAIKVGELRASRADANLP